MTTLADVPASAVRTSLVRLMRQTLLDQEQHHTWTYQAIRPLVVPATWKPGQRVTADCSKGVQMLCRWAGGPDPMGMDYGLWGNSSTIAAHLAHVERAFQLAAGDIVTFGPGGSKHAAMVLEPGADPLLWSHGHPGAPNTYRLSHDRREKQFLRLPVPLAPPSPAEQLRARTGYWAWLAWTLGEQDWLTWGKSNREVRPNVPKLIPPAWWRLRVAFLLARKHGNEPDG